MSADLPPVPPPSQLRLPYAIADDDSSITCGQCSATSHNREDVYFRYCGACQQMLGPSIRQRWNHSRIELRTMCEAFGRYKRVTGHDGIARKVPTEWILTQGIRGDALFIFPAWVEGGDAT